MQMEQKLPKLYTQRLKDVLQTITSHSLPRKRHCKLKEYAKNWSYLEYLARLFFPFMGAKSWQIITKQNLKQTSKTIVIQD